MEHYHIPQHIRGMNIRGMNHLLQWIQVTVPDHPLYKPVGGPGNGDRTISPILSIHFEWGDVILCQTELWLRWVPVRCVSCFACGKS